MPCDRLERSYALSQGSAQLEYLTPQLRCFTLGSPASCYGNNSKLEFNIYIVYVYRLISRIRVGSYSVPCCLYQGILYPVPVAKWLGWGLPCERSVVRAKLPRGALLCGAVDT